MLNNYLQNDWLDIPPPHCKCFEGDTTTVYIIAYLAPRLIYIPYTTLFDFITMEKLNRTSSNKNINSKHLFIQVIQLDSKH